MSEIEISLFYIQNTTPKLVELRGEPVTPGRGTVALEGQAVVLEGRIEQFPLKDREAFKIPG